MIKNLVRKEGAPALAYAAHDSSVRFPCSLKILHAGVQFGVSLEFPLPSHGVHDKQLLVFRYEGNNVVPGKSSLTEADLTLPADLARNGDSQPGTLLLTLKEPCSVWYPKEHGSGLGADFPKLVNLAMATEVCICFDVKWLGKNLKRFKEIFKGPREFTGISLLPQFTSAYEKAHWSILKYIKDAEHGACVPVVDLASGVMPSIETAGAEIPPFQDVKHDNPPPYVQVSRKRSKRTGPSLTPDDHERKRVREHSCSSSQTERATPTSPLGAKSIASSTATVPMDVFGETMASVMEQVLPSVLKKELTEVVEKQLTKVVKKELPHLLEELLRKTLAGPSPSRCLSPAPPCTQIPNELTHDDPTLGTMIKGAVATVLREALNEAHDQSSELYKSASTDLEERCTELKGDMAASTEDYVANCNADLNEMEAKFKQRLEEDLNDFEARADEVVLETEDRLNMVGDQALCRLGGLPTVLEQGQRATSLPVSKEDKEKRKRGMDWI